MYFQDTRDHADIQQWLCCMSVWHLLPSCRMNLQKADISPVCLRTWSIQHKPVCSFSKQPTWREVLDACEGGLSLSLCLVHYSCVCVCCSAPAEGRTVRPWSAWCRSPGRSWGFWINTFPPASPCLTVLTPPHPLAWLWAIYGISMD